MPTVLLILLAITLIQVLLLLFSAWVTGILNGKKQSKLNIGLDLGLLKNKFTLSAEYFNRKTDNLILSVPLPPSMGFITSTVAQNVGSMKNNGFEVQLGYNDREGDFKWNASANFTILNK